MKKHTATLLLLLAASVHAEIKVACIGNSITQGYPSSYVPVLQQLLGPGYTVLNEGVGGTTMLKAGDSPYWANGKLWDVFVNKPDIVTIKLGTNDTKPQNWDVHGADFKADCLAMIDTVNTLSSKPRIFLALPAPIWNNNYSIRNSILPQIITAINQIAVERSLPVIDCNTPLLNHPELFPDGVHPNQAGADSLARIFHSAITKFISTGTGFSPIPADHMYPAIAGPMLSLLPNKIALNIPGSEQWTIEFCALNGAKLAAFTGRGCKEITLADHIGRNMAMITVLKVGSHAVFKGTIMAGRTH